MFTFLTNDYTYLRDKYANDHMLWGWFAPYPMFIFAGVMAAIIASVVKFRLKRIPLNDLTTAIFLIIPVGILFASFFGKLGTSDKITWKVWEYFYFWEPGMNLFGGLLGGTAAGFAYYWRKRNKRLISIWVYADCIVPNILLAQSIGRWGNLFNHEIMGKAIDVNKIQWLPNWIWERLFYFYDPSTGTELTGPIVFHEPLFLYESLATLILWLLLSFIFPNLGRWFSKKPWKYNKKAYPCTFNKEWKWAKEEDIEFFPLQAPIKYKENKQGLVSLSLFNVWNKAYYLRDPDGVSSAAIQKRLDTYNENWEKYCEAKKAIYKKWKQEKAKAFKRFKNKKSQLKEILLELKSKRNQNLQELQKPAPNSFSHWWKRDARDLYKLHNRHNYFIVHCGFLTSMYLMLYTIVRFILETRRSVYELSVRNSWTLDILAYLGLFAIGVALFLFAQFIAPKKWREEKWLYEKSY